MTVLGGTLIRRIQASENTAASQATSINASNAKDLVLDASINLLNAKDLVLDASVNLLIGKEALLERLQQNEVLPAESVFSGGYLHESYNRSSGKSHYIEVMEVDRDVFVQVFDNSVNTHVNPQFLLDSSAVAPPAGSSIYYYNGSGTDSAIIDGSAGTPVTGVSGNIGQPIWTTVADISTALVKNYANIDPSGLHTHLQYSSWIGNRYSVDNAINAKTVVMNYFGLRGYVQPSPIYNTSADRNFFLGRVTTGGAIGMDLVYTSSAIVPSSVNLVFSGVNAMLSVDGNFVHGIGSKQYSLDASYVRPLVNIAVTTTFSTFATAVKNGTNSIYYDTVKKHINVNFVVANTWNFAGNSALLDLSYNLTSTMNYLVGSWAVMKKNTQVSFPAIADASINYNQFIQTYPTDPDAFLIQISPTLIFKDTSLYNNTSLGVATSLTSGNTRTLSLIDPTTGEYSGLTMPRHGFGNTGSLSRFIYSNTFNAATLSDVGANLGKVSGMTTRVGDNPYTRMIEPYTLPGQIDHMVNDLWPTVMFRFNDIDLLLNSTPESLVLMPSSDYLSTDMANSADRAAHYTAIAVHEDVHLRQFATGAIDLINAEGRAVACELDLYRSNVTPLALDEVQYCTRYVQQAARGQFPLDRKTIYYRNDKTLSLSVPADALFYSYSENIFYTYLIDHYDRANQVARRQEEILMVTSNKVLKDNNMLFPIEVRNRTCANFALHQALYDLSGNLTLPNVYRDYAVSLAFIRNNTTIPMQYKTLFPFWMINKHNSFSAKMTTQWATSGRAPASPLREYMGGWTDLDETTPMDYNNFRTSEQNKSYFNGQTIIPFWPRDASGITGPSMENIYKIHFNRRNASDIIIDFSLNTIPYATSNVVELEDLAYVAYILPVQDVSAGLVGISNYMTAMDISVNRGHWSFTVVQFVPDGTDDGSWNQLPSTGAFSDVDVCGNYQESLVGAYSDVSGAAQSVSFDLSGLSVRYYNGIAYYPKLVCVNRGLYDYGPYLNIQPAVARYSGKITMTPTFIGSISALRQYEPMSAESAYSGGNGHLQFMNSSISYPITEVSQTITTTVFTDDTNTTIAPQFMIDCSAQIPLAGQIYYYATDGSTNSIIDGTLSDVSNVAGVVGHIGKPLLAAPGDLTALARTYKNIDPSGVKQLLNYSSWASSVVSVPTFVNALTQQNNYFLQRGYPVAAPASVPTDINLFSVKRSGCGIFMDLSYGSTSVPTSMYLAFTNYRNGTSESLNYTFGSRADSLDMSFVRAPVNIAVTTSFSTFATAVKNGTNSVYYDTVKKHININFAVQNVWTYIEDISGFGVAQRTTVNKMNSFVGSFAVMKKNTQVSFVTVADASINYNQFIQTYPQDPEAFLQQISPTITFQEETLDNGVSSGVKNVSVALTDTTTGEFVGVMAPRYGFGQNGTITVAALQSYFNAQGVPDDRLLTPAITGKTLKGDNPYSTILEPHGYSGVVRMFVTSDIYHVHPDFQDISALHGTPEAVADLSSSFLVLSTPANSKLNIFNSTQLHEEVHRRQSPLGVLRLVNTEGMSYATELDGPLYLDGGYMFSRYEEVTSYLNSFYRGYYVLGKYQTTFGFAEDKYSVANLIAIGDISGFVVRSGISTTNFPLVRSGMYGEGEMYRYIIDQYDNANQVQRRIADILQVTACKVMADNNMPLYSPNLSVRINNVVANFAMKQALSELCSKDLSVVFSDHAVATMFLRNNAAIPTQYRTKTPYWGLWNEHNKYNAILSAENDAIPSFYYQHTTLSAWSDIDETNPLDFYKYGYSAIYAGAFSAKYEWAFFADGQTRIPVWPRDASGENQYKIRLNVRDASYAIIDASSSFNLAPYRASKTVELEDMATVCYVLPVQDVSAGMLGISSYMTAMDISVNRGHWSFTVVQFVPDGADGSWNQLPSTGNYYDVDVCGNYHTSEDVSGSYTDVSGATEGLHIDLTGLSVKYYDTGLGLKAYYPKLVCVNRGLYDYGEFKNIYPAKCRYSGMITMTPTLV